MRKALGPEMASPARTTPTASVTVSDVHPPGNSNKHQPTDRPTATDSDFTSHSPVTRRRPPSSVPCPALARLGDSTFMQASIRDRRGPLSDVYCSLGTGHTRGPSSSKPSFQSNRSFGSRLLGASCLRCVVVTAVRTTMMVRPVSATRESSKIADVPPCSYSRKTTQTVTAVV